MTSSALQVIFKAQLPLWFSVACPRNQVGVSALDKSRCAAHADITAASFILNGRAQFPGREAQSCASRWEGWEKGDPAAWVSTGIRHQDFGSSEALPC